MEEKNRKKKKEKMKKEKKELDVEELGCLEGFLEISKEGRKTNISRWKLWKKGGKWNVLFHSVSEQRDEMWIAWLI